VPLHARSLPLLEPLHVGAGLDEELHLHLLELARAEDEVAGRDLVAERLADLRDAERHLLTRALLHVQEVHEDPLRRFRAQVDDGSPILDRPHERLEHQVELARLGELAGVMLTRLLARLLRAARVLELVGAEAPLHVLQSTSGSVKPATCPLASHTRGCMRIAASSPSMSSRSAPSRATSDP
jgi:hypothetical protein